MTSKKQKRKERVKIRELQKDKYLKKGLTRKDFDFNNRQTNVRTTMDIKKFLNDHVVWCPICNPKFTTMIMHAKTSDNKKMMADSINETRKFWSGKN